MDEAVRVARRYVDDPVWRARADRRAKDALGPDLYARSRSGWAAKMCRRLARCAAFLLELGPRAERLVAGASGPVLRWIGVRRLEELIARKFAEHVVPAALPVKVITVARAMQAYGVLICVLEGRDLAHCACLRPLATSVIKEEIQAQVEETVGPGLDRLAI